MSIDEEAAINELAAELGDAMIERLSKDVVDLRATVAALQAANASLREAGRACEAERDRVIAAVQAHHDQRGDDRCHLDDGKLYSDVLGVGADPYAGALPPTEDMEESCRRYIQQRRCPGPQGVVPLPGDMTIRQLTDAVASLTAERDEARRERDRALAEVGASHRPAVFDGHTTEDLTRYGRRWLGLPPAGVRVIDGDGEVEA